MAEVLPGRRKSGPLRRDGDRHRTYAISHIVKVDPDTEGHYSALNAVGLPVVGTEWDFDGDYDPWAFCQPDANVEALSPSKEGERPEFYEVTQTFSTKPQNKCSEQQRDDPLLEPMHVSGDYKNTKEESSFDRFGRPIVTSSWELIRSKDNEWDIASATVNIEQNVGILEEALCWFMMNKLNMFELWGAPRRCVKLSSFTFEKKYYGQCYAYYTRKFGFEINFNTFDRYILDEGTKALRGKWLRAATQSLAPLYQLQNNPNRFKPADFIRYVDPNGNPGKVILNGFGLPSGACIDFNNADEQELPPVRTFVAVPYQGVVSDPNDFDPDNPLSFGLVGKSIDDWDNWIQVAGGATPALLDAEPYSESIHYIRGNLVTFGNQIYVCISDTFQEGIVTSFNWRVLTLGLNERGAWSATTTYVLGDVVTEPGAAAMTGTGTGNAAGCQESGTGKVFVQKFHEADLSMLGLPATL